MSWSNNYVGLDYGAYDCWDLVVHVLAREFGIDCQLQRFVPLYGSMAEADAFEAQYERFCENWREVDTAEEGDLVVFSEHRHIGIMISPDRFLHSLQHTDAVVEKLDDYWSTRVSGFYRHNSRFDSSGSSVQEPAI